MGGEPSDKKVQTAKIKMKLLVRLDCKIQSIVDWMLVNVDHSFDSELLNSLRRDKHSRLQTSCWAHEIKAKRHGLSCSQDQKLPPWILRKGALFVIMTEVLGHSPKSRASPLSGGISWGGPLKLWRCPSEMTDSYPTQCPF